MLHIELISLFGLYSLMGFKLYVADCFFSGRSGLDPVLERYPFFKGVLTPVAEAKVLIINWRRIIISSGPIVRCDTSHNFRKLKCS